MGFRRRGNWNPFHLCQHWWEPTLRLLKGKSFLSAIFWRKRRWLSNALPSEEWSLCRIMLWEWVWMKNSDYRGEGPWWSVKLSTSDALIFPAGPLSWLSSWISDPESPNLAQSDQKAQLQMVLGGGLAQMFGKPPRRTWCLQLWSPYPVNPSKQRS